MQDHEWEQAGENFAWFCALWGPLAGAILGGWISERFNLSGWLALLAQPGGFFFGCGGGFWIGFRVLDFIQSEVAERKSAARKADDVG